MLHVLSTTHKDLEDFRQSQKQILERIQGIEKRIKLMDLDYSIEIVTYRGIHGNKNSENSNIFM